MHPRVRHCLGPTSCDRDMPTARSKQASAPWTDLNTKKAAAPAVIGTGAACCASMKFSPGRTSFPGGTFKDHFRSCVLWQSLREWRFRYVNHIATPNAAHTGKAALVRSVQELYRSGNLADVSLIVGGRTIPAHRHVLAPHSPVFRRMWQHDMSEVSLAPACVRIGAPTESYSSDEDQLDDVTELCFPSCQS